MLVWACTALLVLIRLLSATMTAPLLGHRHVGIWPRVMITAGLTMAVLPLVPTTEIPCTPVAIGEACLTEALFGALLGLGMTILFASAAAAGSVIGQMAGLQLLADTDPEFGGSPLTRLMALLSLAVFAAMGGMELLLSGVLDSIAAIPIGTTISADQIRWLLVELLRQSFLLILRCIAPPLAAMLVATYVIGMVQRSFPGLNSMGIGLTSNLVIMLLAVLLTLGGTMWLLIDDMQHASQWVNITIRQLVAPNVEGP